MAVNQVAISEAGNVQLSVEGAQETQIVLAVPGIQGPAGASASGTVQYVDLSGVSPIAVSGDPVTTSGSFEVSIDESLLSIAPSQLSDGTLPSGVTVSGISLAASINDLSDVDTATVAPASGEALVWNGSEWNPGPAGAEAAGNAIGQIQYNDGTSPPGLAASSGLVWDDTGKVLEVGGDINLDDGGSFQTTLQLVTPTAARTITFPDATGTVGLVAGSTGQLVYNNAGAYSGLSGVTTDGTDITLTGRFISSLNGAASAPPGTFTGTWFTGGTATTTKPQVLIEPTGTTSTAWSTSGTGLGVNAASGFAGNLLDLQTNGTSRAVVTGAGNVGIGTATPSFLSHIQGAAGSSVENVLMLAGGTTSTTGAGARLMLANGAASPSRHAYIQGVCTEGTGNGHALVFGTNEAASQPTERARIDSSGRLGLGVTSPSSLFHLADAGDITVGTTTGTKIGTATTQKLGFYNATPVVQPAAVADATDAPSVITQLNDLLAKLRTLGIIAT
jgi:hypothetical protein